MHVFPFVLGRLAPSALAGLMTAALVFGARPAGAAELRGSTIAPDWSLGSPQPVGIRICSDVVPFRCVGHFGLGGLSDVLEVHLLGRSFFTEASLSENRRLFVGGLLEAGNEQQNDWWNLWIPNARWVRGAVFNLFDRDDRFRVVGDSIAYVNINGAAHILWSSNRSDDTSDLPPDYVSRVDSFGLSPTNVTANDGIFDNSNIPPPLSEDCTTDPRCTPTAGFQPVPSVVPEPASLALLSVGLLGLSAVVRRRLS